MRSTAYYQSDYYAEITRRELNPYTGHSDYVNPPTISEAEKAYDKYYVVMGMHDFRVKFKGEIVEKFAVSESAHRLADALNNLRRIS
ncbi:MAG TPA: hypothetical protein PKL77_07315 [Candidatus Omnitrophota bacterium]|nr:hypothetical protein [Candidatus Omnitrophota bacterium]